MHNIQDVFESVRYAGVMVYPLMALALIALVISIDKFYIYLRYVKLPAVALQLVETYDFSWADLERLLKRLGTRNYFSRFFQVILNNRDKPAWWVESRAGDEAHLIQQSLGRGLWVLETIVTVAPLLGLLGTIDGMMDSFKLIGNAGLVDPAGITGGVAQALIATAIGLVIAIVSLFAFNFFSARQSHTVDEMERLGTRLLDHIRLDQHVREAAREAA
jgi:biopolymer transport protein ExbB